MPVPPCSRETRQSSLASLALFTGLLGVNEWLSTVAEVSCALLDLRNVANWYRKYEHFSHVSLSDYFLQLLELQIVDWLRLPLLQGMATSTVTGAEGLIRATRTAMTQHINTQEPEKRHETVMTVLKDLSSILRDNLHDDRYAIPTIELLAFLIDGYIPSIPEGTESTYVLIPKNGRLD